MARHHKNILSPHWKIQASGKACACNSYVEPIPQLANTLLRRQSFSVIETKTHSDLKKTFIVQFGNPKLNRAENIISVAFINSFWSPAVVYSGQSNGLSTFQHIFCICVCVCICISNCICISYCIFYFRLKKWL